MLREDTKTKPNLSEYILKFDLDIFANANRRHQAILPPKFFLEGRHKKRKKIYPDRFSILKKSPYIFSNASHRYQAIQKIKLNIDGRHKNERKYI